MKRLAYNSLAVALMALASPALLASTAYGDLNNFDTINDTGQDTHGFEIEIEGARSTDITYTYDWNHYGVPTITDDLSVPTTPKVRIRYESKKNFDGSWASYTAVPPVPIGPTGGHQCTDPSVNMGCEHFGVGYYGAPVAIRYYWLVDDGAGNLVRGPQVMVATPSFTYVPPAPLIPAKVVAAIPAPEDPIPAGKEFGEPSFVKVIKTTTHSVNKLPLRGLISADKNGDGVLDWQNGEPSQVETEFYLLQKNTGANPGKQELVGASDDAGSDGGETVTRRYEFYKYDADNPLYAASGSSRDGETGEAMCDSVQPTTDPNNPLYHHGVGTSVEVTDPLGGSYFINCQQRVVVGDYIGAQMAGFDAGMPLGLADNLPDGSLSVAYTPRTLVLGGNSPYVVQLTKGSLPAGMSLGDYTDPVTSKTSHGVLHGTPTVAGTFYFTVRATDANIAVASHAYKLRIAGLPQFALSVGKIGNGKGKISGAGISCGSVCDVWIDQGTMATLSAVPAAGSVFAGWNNACAGTGKCAVTVNADTIAIATFNRSAPPVLSVADVSTTESDIGTKAMTFTAKLSYSPPTDVTFDASTADGTATAGSDYVASNLVGLTIPAGTTSKTFKVTVNSDLIPESNETFMVNLSNAVGATIGDGQAVGTIVDNDNVVPTLSISDVSMVEGDTGTQAMKFTVTMSKALSTNVTFDVTTADGTATARSDYVPLNLTGSTIPSGLRTKSFNVTIKNDLIKEADETFFVNLANASGATILDGQAVGTIINND